MPELPEVEVLRRSLLPHLVGERIDDVVVRHVGLREPIDRAALAATCGRRIAGLRRRSKYLLIDLEGDLTLVVHLGMSGRLTLVDVDVEAEAHEHVAFRLGDRRLRFRDPRRFGLLFAVRTSGLAADGHFSELGPEPLSSEFDGRHLAVAAARRRGPIKSFLMDARVVVGVGNIYANEACHVAGVHPGRGVHRLAAGRFDRLAAAVVGVLEQAIEQGGTTLNDFADGEGRSGYFQVSLAVYGRAGEPCPRCAGSRGAGTRIAGTRIAGTIRRGVQAGRGTFWCPRCQR